MTVPEPSNTDFNDSPETVQNYIRDLELQIDFLKISTGLRDKRGRPILVGHVVHWSDGGDDLDITTRIKTRWDRIAVVQKDPDISFKVIDSPHQKVREEGHVFHYGNFIYRESEEYLTIVADSEAEYASKFHNAAECMIWVAA